MTVNRRRFLRAAASTGVCLSGFPLVASQRLPTWTASRDVPNFNQTRETIPGVKPLPETLEICLPRGRVPLTFIIDDSTCLVNMASFAMPQFAQAWPKREEYDHPWKEWPREIPDRFVREFGEWCAAHGVKGKYSIIPYPACVGWLDRELPGWSRRELRDSLKLVQELMLPNWDIHPEMITHTRVIDLKTGRPIEPVNAASMENSFPQEKISVDELANYLAYALRILQRCDLPCEGITTPGGFGNAVKSELSLAVREALSDVFRVEIPHYFKYVATGDESTSPRLEHADFRHLQRQLTVNIPAGTGDWFGGWHGVRPLEADRYANPDATTGRMVELIERGEPAFMLCHWPGLYNNGTKEGFRAFQQIVVALKNRFGDRTLWMKLSEIARYWAVKETVDIKIFEQGSLIRLQSPFKCPDFTIRLRKSMRVARIMLRQSGTQHELREVKKQADLVSGSFLESDADIFACFQLPKGSSELNLIRAN